MDATGPERSIVHFASCPTSTTALDSAWQNRSGGWRDGNGSLHHYIPTVETISHCLIPRGRIPSYTTLCFLLADIYREKFFSQHWLQLVALMFCRHARIRILDQHTYTLDKPIAVLEALSIVHDWSCTNMGERLLRRTVWQDRKAIFEHPASTSSDNSSNTTVEWLFTHCKTRSNYLSRISYADTDILEALGTLLLCCPSDLVSYSTMTC